MIQGFDYIADYTTTTLVIGSMPGIASLDAYEYYAHKHNLFWHFVFNAFDKDYNTPSYSDKISLLLKNHIGLWDVVHSCTREGSLDTNIKNVQPNDFGKLFIDYPNIQRLLFNGKKAFELFRRYNKDWLDKKEFSVLPSTSPANASIPFDKKRFLWISELRKTL